MDKKKGIDKRISIELLLEMRQKFQALPKEMSHANRAEIMIKEYSQFTRTTLEAYSSTCIHICQDVFDKVIAGKISITALAEFSSAWDEKTQKYIANEFVEQGLTVTNLRQIKQLKREHSTMGYSEAIDRARGKIPSDQPRKEQKKSLDQVLTQIADYGVRWRAMVEMAFEMVRDEDASAGVHEAIFEKVFILRQLVGEQYDAINSRVQRYMNMIKKKAKETQQSNSIEGQPEMVLIDDVKGPKIIEADFVERKDDAGPSPAVESKED